MYDMYVQKNSTLQQLSLNFEYHFKEDFSAPKMRVREDKRQQQKHTEGQLCEV